MLSTNEPSHCFAFVWVPSTPTMSGATGHRRDETLEYNNKNYTVPVFDREEGCVRIVLREGIVVEHGPDDVLVNDLNVPVSMDRYKVARRPLNCGVLDPWEKSAFVAPRAARNVLDMRIKFAGSDFRLPMEYAQWASVVQRVADAEWALNKRCHDEYDRYMTLRRERVAEGCQGRYAPCHVDGFQGARWTPKVRTNTASPVKPAANARCVAVGPSRRGRKGPKGAEEATGHRVADSGPVGDRLGLNVLSPRFPAIASSSAYVSTVLDPEIRRGTTLVPGPHAHAGSAAAPANPSGDSASRLEALGRSASSAAL
jgi:hypothetical protein